MGYFPIQYLDYHCVINNKVNAYFRGYKELFGKFGGPEKGRFGKWCTDVLLKHVLRGYGEPAGCPWA